MHNNDVNLSAFVSEAERYRVKKFWWYCFGMYAIAEAIYSIINYSITRSMCMICVLPSFFYLGQWLINLLFTGLLWYILNAFYHHSLWKIVTANILIFAAYYFLSLCILYAVMHSGTGWLVGEKTTIPTFRNLIYNSWFDIARYVLKLSAFYVLKIYFEYRKAQMQRVQLAVINKDMQLNLLKQQLSPHFYFNTLNNLYGLARANSIKLSGALSQLSNIMEYVIVDCNQPKVLLAQEVNFLESYIALEKLRYEQNTVIEMQVQGNANGQTILPLLLIQFVENAFKHGMKEKGEQNWMKIKMVIQEEGILFTVDNSSYEMYPSKGIGINSVQRILNLQYEGKYDMQINKGNNRFSIILKLNLS